MKKQINLDMLAKELKPVSNEIQMKIKGGSYSLSVVSIVGDPPPSFNFEDPGIVHSYDFDHGPPPIGHPSPEHTPSDPQPGKVEDPEGILANNKTKAEANLLVLKEMLDSGKYPPTVNKSDIEDSIAANEKVRDIIVGLEKSNHNYRFESAGVDDRGGVTFMDVSDNTIVVRIHDTNDFPVFVHELAHVDQIERGQLGFDSQGHQIGYDLGDEVAAYQLQHYFNYGLLANQTDLYGKPYLSGDYEVNVNDILERWPDLYGDLLGTGNNGEIPGDPATSIDLGNMIPVGGSNNIPGYN